MFPVISRSPFVVDHSCGVSFRMRLCVPVVADCKMDLVTSAIEDGNLSEVQLYLRVCGNVARQFGKSLCVSQVQSPCPHVGVQMPFEFTSEEIDFLTLFCCRRFRLQLLHLFAGRSG